MQQLCYTISECSSAIRVKRSKLYQLLNEGELDSILVGRRRLVLTDSVDRFLTRKLAETGKVVS